MESFLSNNKVIQKRVAQSLKDSAYVEEFLSRKFGKAYTPKSPKPRHVKVYTDDFSPSSRYPKPRFLKVPTSSPPTNRLKESLT